MADEQKKEEGGEIPKCGYDKKFLCLPELKKSGCDICLKVQSRDALYAIHANIKSLLQLQAPGKIVHLGDIKRGGRI